MSSHKQKRIRQLKRQAQKGLVDPDKDNPFEMFVSSTQIRWCYYAETHRVLGQTFGMCILQDFEALTPNLLARTIETVEGGGIVVLLLQTMSSLRNLYTLSMCASWGPDARSRAARALAQDVHSRFRTSAHGDVVARFNERFLLSLASCPNALADAPDSVVDDELNILPLSARSREIAPVHMPDGAVRPARPYACRPAPPRPAPHPLTRIDNTPSTRPPQRPDEVELAQLNETLRATPVVGQLVACARTVDQARAVMLFMQAITEKTLRTTVALTAGRGRGKSAALGLAMAGAIAYGYSNVFVTSPSPENLQTLFGFVLKGFEALGLVEHADFEVLRSPDPDMHGAVLRVNVFKSHRQTIQYIGPEEADKVAQAELVVVDEAAAIPLPLVRRLLGPYLVFLSSTVSGYEGTGRSLSLKLIKQLRQQSAAAPVIAADAAPAAPADAAPATEGPADAATATATATAPQGATSAAGRVLRELQMEVPIRYASGDPVEQWLNEVLCLNATVQVHPNPTCPHPNSCELSGLGGLPAADAGPLRGLALPQQPQRPADHVRRAAHNLFVLLGPVDEASNVLPEILCVVQLALEGEIAREAAQAALARGERLAGDLIPWTISQQVGPHVPAHAAHAAHAPAAPPHSCPPHMPGLAL
ncbi:putative RNA cytidine acetyltransferase [Paratrimastix pyriformis]|uniref:RNA cytidine acetyltransferase n=1 Tax=Paratrimastix pyriformis TaxID=342808 RepID=A0ABQ8UW18_9EUKA|nr:putative RNA cytidine acetyltransferase [Paratrimastix pyriformis]